MNRHGGEGLCPLKLLVIPYQHQHTLFTKCRMTEEVEEVFPLKDHIAKQVKAIQEAEELLQQDRLASQEAEDYLQQGSEVLQVKDHLVSLEVEDFPLEALAVSEDPEVQVDLVDPWDLEVNNQEQPATASSCGRTTLTLGHGTPPGGRSSQKSAKS